MQNQNSPNLSHILGSNPPQNPCSNSNKKQIKITPFLDIMQQNNRQAYRHMIAAEDIRYPKLINKQSSQQLLQKTIRIDISKLNVQQLREFYPAFKNTFICVDVQTAPASTTSLITQDLLNNTPSTTITSASNTNNVTIPPLASTSNQVTQGPHHGFNMHPTGRSNVVVPTLNPSLGPSMKMNTSKPTHHIGTSNSGPSIHNLAYGLPSLSSSTSSGANNLAGVNNPNNNLNSLNFNNLSINPPNPKISSENPTPNIVNNPNSIKNNPDVVSSVNNVNIITNQNPNPVQNPKYPIKRVIHFTADCKILGQLIIEQPQYQIFMMSQSYVSVYQYCNAKKNSFIVQWNLQTNQVISVRYNREIFPQIKIFCFNQSDTFCIVQHDHHTENVSTAQNSQSQRKNTMCKQGEQVSYHTKFKLAYFKFPLKKTIQKPYMVFKTHTNPKQYGYHQQIMKLNHHSMIGSVSTRMNQNNETLLKTYDFKNNPMGVEVNYKFHVQINYKKELLHLWISDIWEIRPQNFYLKCQLRLDRQKQQNYHRLYPKLVNQTENLQECIHLTWAYKDQNTLKFAKFKTPMLNYVQFIDGFNCKQRMRNFMQKTSSKQKVVRIDQFYQPTSTSVSTLPSSISIGSSINPYIQPSVQINSSTKLQQIYSPPIYIKSIFKLPVYYINNWTQEIIMIDRQYVDWMATYPTYAPRTVVYYRVCPTSRQNQKMLQVAFHKIRENYNNRQISINMLNCLYNQWDLDLIKMVYNLSEQAVKPKQLEQGWQFLQGNRNMREIKSKSNIQIK